MGSRYSAIAEAAKMYDLPDKGWTCGTILADGMDLELVCKYTKLSPEQLQ